MPKVLNVIETAVYVNNLDQAKEFYANILGLELMGEQAERHLFFRVGESVLLVFNPASTQKGSYLPAHGATGASHFALGISITALEEWRLHLQEHEIEIEREVEWPLGGRSFYFRDPGGNLVELLTPGCWGLPSGW